MPEGRFDHGKGPGERIRLQLGAELAGERRLARCEFPPEEICGLAAKQIAGEFA